MIFALVLCWVSTTAAFSVVAPPHPYETLIVDSRVPVLVGNNWMMMSQEEHMQYLRKRADADASSASSSSDSSSTDDLTTTTVSIEITTSTSSSSTKTTMTRATTTAASSPLPSPFDNAIAANFTGNGDCQDFITKTLANSTFKQCYPFSMLVQGSLSMFNAEKSLVTITQVLDSTCAANVTFCADYLDTLASNLLNSANCADDYSQQNSLAVEFYQGLRAYQPLYSASCLQDAETSAYCFANAVTNSSAIADVYLYYLPLNITYPNTTIPDCNHCTQNVMGIFQAATTDRTSAIANTYVTAATAINAQCGSGYVNATLPEAVVKSFAVPTQQAPSLMLLSLLIIGLSQWLL